MLFLLLCNVCFLVVFFRLLCNVFCCFLLLILLLSFDVMQSVRGELSQYVSEMTVTEHLIQ